MSLAAIAYLVYRLGASWFNPAVGILAAAIVLTRQPVLLYASISYVDIPYAALVLAALLTVSRRPRAGWPVLALLSVAGLLRPEAWLFSAAYVLFLAYSDPERPRGAVLAPMRAFLRRPAAAVLIALAASAPMLWMLHDLLTAGYALHSLTGTQETVQTLERDTGLADGLTLAPRRLGEIVREPALVAAVGGGVLALALMRRRAAVGIAAGALALTAFVILAAAGLAVITRYMLLTSIVVMIFAAAGVLGWATLPSQHPWRRPWIAFGAVAAVLFVAFAPVQAGRLGDLRDAIALEQRIVDDLERAADSMPFAKRCGPVAVPNHRPVPSLALWLDRRPSEIKTAQLVRPREGFFFSPATPEVERTYILEPGEPAELIAEVPGGFSLAYRNRSWEVYERCGRS